MLFKAKNGAEILEKIDVEEEDAIKKFINLNYVWWTIFRAKGATRKYR